MVQHAPAAWRNRIVGHDDVSPDALLANPRNWRLHPEHQQSALRGVLNEVGWVSEVTVNQRSGFVVDGHLRVALALTRHEPSVPVRYVDLDDAEERMVLATLDPIGALAGSDAEQLAALLEGLEPADEAVANLLRELAPPRVKELNPDDADLTPPEEPVTQPGDLWLLGDHRLLCGDSTEISDVMELMGGVHAAACFTDPPYGVAYRDTGEGAWGPAKLARKKAGLVKPRFAAISADELAGEDLVEFWASFLKNVSLVLDAKGAVYCCFASLRARDVFLAFERAHFDPRAELIWLKSRPGFNFAHYKHQHEPILYAVRAGGTLNWYGDATQVSVLNVRSEPGRDYEHPTQKPPELAAIAMRNSTRAGEVVIDLFGGSGSTLVAAEQEDRRAFVLEIEPAYCDVIVRRWERVSGRQAVKANA